MRTTIFALILALAGVSQARQAAPQAVAPPRDLNTLIDGVDKTFASMKDFSARFFQISTDSVNQTHQDEGHLYLTRDKKMRVDYQKPEQKLWVSNGKTLYTYIPANRQATQDPVKDTMADQMPMLYLIGRSGIRKEFKEIRQLPDVKPLFEGDWVLQLTPTKKNQDIQRIEIEVSPRTTFVDRMKMTYTDKSSTEFVFLNIEINRNLPASTFEFTPPPGIRVLQGSAAQ